MEGRKKYLQDLNAKEAALSIEQEQLDERREFYNICHSFFEEDMEAVLRHIVPMISKVEGEEYVDQKFSMKEADHYETEWISPIENLPGVNGAEIAATAKPHKKLVRGSSFQTRLIVTKSVSDTFGVLSFSKCDDFKNSLLKLITTKKFVELRGKGFKAEKFSEMFPYVSEYLGRLTDWRLENNTEEIPEDVLATIAETVTAETLSKTQNGPVKVATKE